MLLVIPFFSTLFPAIFRPSLIFSGEKDSFGFSPLFFYSVCSLRVHCTRDTGTIAKYGEITSRIVFHGVSCFSFFFQPFFFSFFAALFSLLFNWIFLGTRRVIAEISRWLCSPLLFFRYRSFFVIFAKRRCFETHTHTHTHTYTVLFLSSDPFILAIMREITRGTRNVRFG